MTQANEANDSSRIELVLAELALLSPAEGAALLEQRALTSAESVFGLAQAALTRAEHQPADAARWLAIADRVNNSSVAPSAANTAWIAYARGRLHLAQGDLQAAETSVRAAQTHWRQLNERTALARSQLGLTQILAMQGRFADADVAVSHAIELLDAQTKDEPALLFQLAVAHRNRASLLSVQDRHRAAVAAFDDALAILAALSVNQGSDEIEPDAVDAEHAHLLLTQAVSFMYVDRINEADVALQRAIAGFDRLGDRLNRGRARTNLGTLFVLTGRYAGALDLFDEARQDLLGVDSIGQGLGAEKADDSASDLHQAAVLLLDQASAYLVLNLRPEAVAGLDQCEALFRRAGQPYELGQTLYMRALLLLGNDELDGAATALGDALDQFDGLDNHFWLNRVRLAQALVAYRRADYHSAAMEVDALLASSTTGMGINEQAEAQFLQLHLALDGGDLGAARAASAEIERLLVGGNGEANMPHLRWRLAFAQGLISRAAGDLNGARHHLFDAVDLIESQRVSLPLEEVRSAYLDDKADVYAELVATLLDMRDDDEIGLARAFDVVERARSRALLERLLAATPDERDDPLFADSVAESRRIDIRSRLHWLYNQLLGGSENRHLAADISQAITEHENALQQLEWRRSPLLVQAEPASLGQLQRALEPDEQAVVYFTTAHEVLAFVVDGESSAVIRDLCTRDEVDAALRNWRFELGRVEIGGDYVARHRVRLMQGAQAALARLYDLLISPIASSLRAARLHFIPHGQLHHVPFHALFDGERYLFQRWESAVAPSASITVACHHSRRKRTRNGCYYESLAAFAISEPGLPNVRGEAQVAAAHFERSQLYIDDDATTVALEQAVASADVVHIATHGLMRSDNPYFSALRLADGWQDVRSLYRLPFTASLVVLSACESGAGQIRGGDELIGLARGFIGAGAPMLVASLWNLHDSSAADLMADFYAELAGKDSSSQQSSPPAALRRAQQRAVEREQHPYFWAPFYVIA